MGALIFSFFSLLTFTFVRCKLDDLSEICGTNIVFVPIVIGAVDGKDYASS